MRRSLSSVEQGCLGWAVVCDSTCRTKKQRNNGLLKPLLDVRHIEGVLTLTLRPVISGVQAPIHPDFLVAKTPATSSDAQCSSEPPTKKQKPNRGMNKNKDLLPFMSPQNDRLLSLLAGAA